jgi:hypothetical protein
MTVVSMAMARCCSRNEKGPCGPSSRSPCTGDPPPVSWITYSIALIGPEVKQRPGASDEQSAAAKTPAAQAALQRQIAATDRQIDQLVYELYGLTEEEIWIVEEATHG